MAWWKTGEGDDIAGDWPADILDQACADILGRGGNGAPWRLARFLAVWQDALNTEPQALLADVEPDRHYWLRAQVAPPDSDAASLVEAEPPDGHETATQRAGRALREVARAYQDAAERKPRLSELRRALRFSFANPLEDGRFAEGALDLLKLDIQPITDPAP